MKNLRMLGSSGILFAVLLFATLIIQNEAYSMEMNTDRPGMDYKNFNLRSAEPKLCEDACVKDCDCKAWTYVKPGVQGNQARCWLKKDIPSPKTNRCCISGVKLLPKSEKCNTIPLPSPDSPESLPLPLPAPKSPE